MKVKAGNNNNNNKCRHISEERRKSIRTALVMFKGSMERTEVCLTDMKVKGNRLFVEMSFDSNKR